MSPEPVVPVFYPSIYDVSSPELTDEEFPAVSTTLQHVSFANKLCLKTLVGSAPKCNVEPR